MTYRSLSLSVGLALALAATTMPALSFATTHKSAPAWAACEAFKHSESQDPVHITAEQFSSLLQESKKARPDDRPAGDFYPSRSSDVVGHITCHFKNKMRYEIVREKEDSQQYQAWGYDHLF
jgi:hypothetical protein